MKNLKVNEQIRKSKRLFIDFLEPKVLQFLGSIYLNGGIKDEGE